MHGLLGLTGVGRWVAALRQHAVDLLAVRYSTVVYQKQATNVLFI